MKCSVLRNKFEDTENKLMLNRWEGCGGEWVKKVKGIKEVQIAGYKISHGAVKYSVRNIVNNILINIYGARWY